MESFHLVKKGVKVTESNKSKGARRKETHWKGSASLWSQVFFYCFNHDPERNANSLQRTPAASRWVSHESFHVSFCRSNTHYPLEEERENWDDWNVVLTEME